MKSLWVGLAAVLGCIASSEPASACTGGDEGWSNITSHGPVWRMTGGGPLVLRLRNIEIVESDKLPFDESKLLIEITDGAGDLVPGAVSTVGGGDEVRVEWRPDSDLLADDGPFHAEVTYEDSKYQTLLDAELEVVPEPPTTLPAPIAMARAREVRVGVGDASCCEIESCAPYCDDPCEQCWYPSYIYPVLVRGQVGLAEDFPNGWLSSRWNAIDPSQERSVSTRYWYGNGEVELDAGGDTYCVEVRVRDDIRDLESEPVEVCVDVSEVDTLDREYEYAEMHRCVADTAPTHLTNNGSSDGADGGCSTTSASPTILSVLFGLLFAGRRRLLR